MQVSGGRSANNKAIAKNQNAPQRGIQAAPQGETKDRGLSSVFLYTDALGASRDALILLLGLIVFPFAHTMHCNQRSPCAAGWIDRHAR